MHILTYKKKKHQPQTSLPSAAWPMRTQDMQRKGEDSLWTMTDAEKNRKQEQMEGERGRNERKIKNKKERSKKRTTTCNLNFVVGLMLLIVVSYSFFLRKGLWIINTWCIGCWLCKTVTEQYFPGNFFTLLH